jgi:hypothetical protein
MVCAAAGMVCATRQNDVRSWQNGVRAISDGTDVLGKMMCALMCALVCALMCAPMAGVPVAQRISFSSWQRGSGGSYPVLINDAGAGQLCTLLQYSQLRPPN